MLLLALLITWVVADLTVKIYFAVQRRRDHIAHGRQLRADLIRKLSREDNQCLDCKRLRGHDDDCALDMSVLPPRSNAGQDVR